MKVWVFVEGPADRLALEALWDDWRARLRIAHHGVSIHPLEGKSYYLRKIGIRAAEKLAGDSQDVVVGLPDLYPNKEYENTEYRHDGLDALQEVQRRQVRQSLVKDFRLSPPDADNYLQRFYPTALKHDLEMLILAAQGELGRVLGTTDGLGSWVKPVENQNQLRPPKRIVEELFLHKSRRKKAYRDTKDAPAVLGKVANLRSLLYTLSGQPNCPAFKETLDWLGEKTGVPAYA
jgi:hypothetical protein